MIRTTTNILDIGMKEAMSSNPLLRQQGYRRLIGASIVLGGANEGGVKSLKLLLVLIKNK